MDTIETPYDEEAEFIECRICEKSIRGETLYKIHLTSPGHLKKEDGLVAAGLCVRTVNVPVFEDILHYLDYMKLDEPIIGLSCLDQVPSNDPHSGPKYTCWLCHQTAHLAEMVRHIIGRKHRQKYMELKRPDLITWDKQSIITQGGKIIRARAEIIERQDGRGAPKALLKKGMDGKFNPSRVPPRQRQNWGGNASQGLTGQNDSTHQSGPLEYHDSQRGRNTQEQHNTASALPQDPYMLNRHRRGYHREDTFNHDGTGEEPQWGNYLENNMHQQEYTDPDYYEEYEEENNEYPPRRAATDLSGDTRYDSKPEMPHTQAQHRGYYQPEAPVSNTYPERDHLKEFYTQEVRRRQQLSAELQASQPSNKPRWPLDKEAGRQDSMSRLGRQGSSEPEARMRSFPSPLESDQLHERSFNMGQNYLQQGGEPFQEEDVVLPGPSRPGPASSHRPREGNRAMSGIPEPFRRFLKGGAYEEEQGKRKRKSRFSDATAEEVQTTREIFNDDYGPPNPKFGSRPRPVSAPMRPESHGTQQPDFYMQSQRTHQTESFQSEGSESEGVLDILKSIEIENAEEANFLKNKLCHLLKEFKSKKSQKVQSSQGRAIYSNDFNSLEPEPEPELSRQQYDSTLRQDSDLRRSEDDLYIEHNQSGRGWPQHEDMPNKWLRDFPQPGHGEARQSNRKNYEEDFMGLNRSWTSQATQPHESAHYPERFQEPMHPQNFQSAAKKYLDPHPPAPAPPLHMQRGPRVERGTRYSNNLDKITSTLLELVARK